MRRQIVILIFAICVVSEIYGDCGCLQCSKDLHVVSPPDHPYKVIVKGPHPPCAPVKPDPAMLPGLSPVPGLPGLPPLPTYIPIPAHPVYPLGLLNPGCQPLYAYKYKVQTPVLPPPPPPLTGLVATPDRLVLQNACPVYNDDGDCGNIVRPQCHSIFDNGYYGSALALRPLPLKEPAPLCAPCQCEYHRGRKKRDLPILRKSVQFLVDLLPSFLRVPLERTLKSLGYHDEKYYRNFLHGFRQKPSETFLEKLKRLNGRRRRKRSLVFEGDGIKLPFLKVTNVENHLEEESDEEEEEEEDSDEEEQVGKIHRRKEYLRPLNFHHLVPQNPIFYLLNAPIRFLHHFHKLGQQISPVFKSVPMVLINSRKYLRNLGDNLRNDVFNFASNLIGDFDETDVHRYGYSRSRRYRRSLEDNLEQYQPEYSLVFQNTTEKSSRRKRYILKVVDEDEVEEFLREKLGGIVEPPERPKKKKEKKEKDKKRLVVEQLSPKLIIDNNGRPFMELDGTKRPLFLNRQKLKVENQNQKQKESEEEEETEDVQEKISSIITKARQRMDQEVVSNQPKVPNQMIKERINQILTEIQDLINLDFDHYSTIHSDLCKLENSKQILINEWKKILMENKSNEMSSKIRLLDDFKELQTLRDKSITDIAIILSKGSNFMTKKLIKMLVRLQKLQCVIYRVIEDFDEKIKMGTDSDVRREIKYVDYLTGLRFVIGQTKQDLEGNLRKERDLALENEMKMLEKLRKLLDNDSGNEQKLYAEAQILWELKNIDKLEKDAIVEMNEKISKGQKVRKELKILFDLLRQLENCEEKQKKLLDEDATNDEIVIKQEKEEEREQVGVKNLKGQAGFKYIHRNSHRKTTERNNFIQKRIFPHKTIIEDKRPIKLVSNGYTMTAYKVSDGFD